jgi:hypothetical protein
MARRLEFVPQNTQVDGFQTAPSEYIYGYLQLQCRELFRQSWEALQFVGEYVLISASTKFWPSHQLSPRILASTKPSGFS